MARESDTLRQACAPSIFSPGHNCWKTAAAGRAAFLIDAASYFDAFMSAVEGARHSILIAAWDFDSRIHLRPGRPAGYFPDELGPLLNLTVKRHRRLTCHVLVWDFARVFELERGVLPLFRHDWPTQRRIKVHFDGNHPIGAAHHQKIVVIDDSIAFCGGIDLRNKRWDTPEHLPDDPRRADRSGRHHPPFHDVQMAVDGPAAAALGDLVRERWFRSTGKRIKPPPREPHDPWPAQLAADLSNVDVAIARTDPLAVGGEAVEIEQFFLDAIAMARRSVYIENQFLSAGKIGEAIAGRLGDERGPEFVIVLPRVGAGWLLKSTMGPLRDKMMQRLRRADRYGRLRVYYPTNTGGDGPGIYVHAKVMVVDDALAIVGSANLANRSLGLDSECALAIESRGDGRRAGAIAGLRDRLLAEHLGASPEEVGQRVDGATLIGAVESLRGGRRTLRDLYEDLPAAGPDEPTHESVFDPEHAIDLEPLLEQILPEVVKEPVRATMERAAVALAVIAGLAFLWVFTLLWDLARPDLMIDYARAALSSRWQPLIAVGAFIVGGFMMLPLSVLVALSSVIFGPLKGFIYALAGAMASSALTFYAGRFVGRNMVRLIAGSRLNHISRRIAGHSIITVATASLLPLATFPVINLVAGASRVRFKYFIVGTLAGIMPVLAAFSVLGRAAETAIRRPTPLNLSVLAALVILFVIVIEWVRRLLLGPPAAGKRP
ncbi:MAG TPA: VTT domain-containing protein [bacterium]|nr:VTT domain-containing protein [bacterium]